MDDVHKYGASGMEEETVADTNRTIHMDEKKIETKTAELSPGWKRTNDIQGHKPTFDPMCVRCKVSLDKDTKMQVRHSVLRLSVNAQKEIYYKEFPPKKPWEPEKEEFDPEININTMSYKCPHCAWFIRFHVKDEREYLQEIYKKRQYSTKFVPLWETDELSDEELKEVERQLQALGYWAGR